jgi:hypothetical protein
MLIFVVVKSYYVSLSNSFISEYWQKITLTYQISAAHMLLMQLFGKEAFHQQDYSERG